MSDWSRIGSLRDFVRGRARVVEVDGVAVAVFRSRDGFVAVGDTCPHMGASLAGGRVVDGHVECPWHHWRYDSETGVSDHRDWARVPVYEIRVDGEEVLARSTESVAARDRDEGPPEDERWIRWDPDRFLRKRRREGSEDG